MHDNEVTSLINLLDDTDSEVVSLVIDRLCAKGEEAIPMLEDAWRDTLEETQLIRLEHVISQIQENSTLQKLKEWANNGAPDLLTGVYYASKLFRPNIEFVTIENQIKVLSREIWLELNEHLTALEQVRLFNRIIFENNKFSAKRLIQNEWQLVFSDLLQGKEGSQVSLGLLYVCIAERLQLPISGINLSNSGMLGYQDIYGDTQGEMLFFIDPYDGGMCGKKQLIDIVKKYSGTEKMPDYYLAPCSKQTLVYRYAHFLGVLYRNTDKPAQQNKANRAAEILREGVPQD